ncbi:MAG: hypothetical protein EBR09_04475, partial [Proteobacteria bacterium]|nr:hypothetical protein [Pseudomonadota bacterium]
MRLDSLGEFSKNYLEHNNDACRITRVLLALLLCIQIFFSAGCSSNAKVSVENYERTEMQERISTVDGAGEAAAQYRTLTASMTEDERSALNELLDLIIGRTPSKADKKATLTSVLKAVSGIFASSGRAGIEADLKSLVTVARTLDAPVRIIADALFDAKQENKSKFLSQTKKFIEDISSDQNSVALAESELAGFKSDGVLVASDLWSKLPADSAPRPDFLKLLFKFAPSSSVQDLNVLLDRALDPAIQSKIYKGMDPLSATDTNLGVFARIQNSLPSAALDSFIKMTSTYTETTLSSPVKTALTEAIKKGLVLKESLRPAYLAELNATAQLSDAQVLLNALVDSIDRTTGEGFFALPQFTVRYLKPTAEPACKLKGTSTANVTFSFRWIIGGNPLADWTTPSATSQNSAGSTFAQSTQVLCSVRIFVSGNKVNELNTELVTVRSSAPTFTSGDPPLPETFTSKKGELFIYNVAARDSVPGPNAFFQLTAQPQHGVVTQTAIGNFEYRPVPAFVGSDHFSFATCNIDNVCSPDKVINLSITDGNQSPRLESMIAPAWNTVAGGLRISRDSTLNDIQLVINEDNVIDSTCAVPHVMVLSGDTAKFPQTTANIEVSGVFPYCRLKLSPAAGIAGLGTTTMTLKLDDQVNPPVLSTFNVNVIDKEPQWSTPATPVTFSVNKNSGAHTLQLNAATDPDASLFATPQTLSYVIVSAPAIGTVSSASAVPAAGNGTITYTTPMGQPNTQPDQTTSFTYKVCDNASPQNCSPNKTITVNIVNNAPVISDIGNQIISEDATAGGTPATPVIPFTVTDADGVRSCSDITPSSSLPAIINASGITITEGTTSGTTKNCSVTVTPVANK